MRSDQIRKTFLDYFAKRGHAVRPSDSLIPSQDPTLLFTTAGMVQFKPLWAGGPLPYPKAASVQKCLRAGGKGSDLENVGRTLRHHTFFEMLGNFSFGDYFKKEAIAYAWEFVGEVLKMPTEQIWVSIYKEDKEAFEIWNKHIGLPEKRIVGLGDKDNFWGPAGSSGACGPCSELHFDLGPSRGCGKKTCAVGCDCERYLEFWNLVFPQFFQQEDGKRRPLERRGIDTGMGLERLAFLLQKVGNNYETDVFVPLVQEIGRHTQVAYEGRNKAAYHVLADHARALAFALSDNVLPSNEGRGYVLRRILRRAVRYATKLGIHEPVVFKLTAAVAAQMQGPYPELTKTREQVAGIVQSEEKRFFSTLAQGTEILEGILQRVRKAKKKEIAGKDVFLLYDTYGLPADFTRDIASEEGLSLDEKGFAAEMEKQKTKARASWVGNAQQQGSKAYEALRQKLKPSQFLGYALWQEKSPVAAILRNGQEVQEAKAGDVVEILLTKTPFYPEGGGQVGDTGQLKGPKGIVDILDTQKPLEGLIVHKGKVQKGCVAVGETVDAAIDNKKRAATMRHHTGTHILQSVLRTVLGKHVKQAGSLVAPDRLRFDFTHFKALEPRELRRIETVMNERIEADAQVTTCQMPAEEVKRSGEIIALFDEKYGDEVRVVDVGGYSKELCGGTHLARAGQTGYFKILSDSSIGAGVRRLEALCGDLAVEAAQKEAATLRELSRMLKTKPAELTAKVTKLLSGSKDAGKAKQSSEQKDLQAMATQLLQQKTTVQGVDLISASVADASTDVLRGVGDLLKQKVPVVVLGSVYDGRVILISMVAPKVAQGGVGANTIIQKIAPIVGGKGGGRPEMAQAGGKDPSKLPEALAAVLELWGQMT